MAKRTRTVVGLAAAALLAGAGVSQAADTGHVRSESPVIKAAIESAIERSATFRRLVEEIDASDSWVFVNEGRCGHGVFACFAKVSSGGSHRFLFVLIDPRKKHPDLMASIGHELRHTIEIIREPSVRTDRDKFNFYEENGMHLAGGERETLAAREAGDAVRSEINTFNRHMQPR